MAYYVEIETPANTPVASPVVETLKMAPGKVRRVQILHPTGCVGLVGVRFLYFEHQVWPENPDGWFTGNGSPITFEPGLAIGDSPFELDVEVYNLDDTFAHAPGVMIDMDFGDDTLELLLARLVEAQQGGVMPGR
jgi:hypothetical protein